MADAALPERLHARLSLVDRAYELARSGACTTLDGIERLLRDEHYQAVHLELSDPEMRRELRQLSRDGARARKAEALAAYDGGDRTAAE